MRFFDAMLAEVNHPDDLRIWNAAYAAHAIRTAHIVRSARITRDWIAGMRGLHDSIRADGLQRPAILWTAEIRPVKRRAETGRTRRPRLGP